jgi:hypothetical protein
MIQCSLAETINELEKLQPLSSGNKVLNIYQAAWRHTPDDSNIS